MVVPLDAGPGLTDPEGFSGYLGDNIAAGTDGEYYVWFGCRMHGDYPETLLVFRRWVDGELVQSSTSSSQFCRSDPERGEANPFNTEESWIDSFDPFDTGVTLANGWGVRESE